MKNFTIDTLMGSVSYHGRFVKIANASCLIDQVCIGKEDIPFPNTDEFNSIWHHLRVEIVCGIRNVWVTPKHGTDCYVVALELSKVFPDRTIYISGGARNLAIFRGGKVISTSDITDFYIDVEHPEYYQYR